jgi:anhydro-N-acetylmuramic acid kinase
MEPRQYLVLGMMSGTSMDGVDLALTQFTYQKAWKYEVLEARTVPYEKEWLERFKKADSLRPEELIQLDHDYGKYLGLLASNFLNGREILLISSHGHTLFHRPEKGYSFQIGHGADLHAQTGLPVVCDFRSVDVALGGQGAPLVPVGETYLFSDYAFLVNLGGIANLTYRQADGKVKAKDFGFANMGLNLLASQKGRSYDDDGQMARKGRVSKDFSTTLEQAYLKIPPVSLSRELFEQFIEPVLLDSKYLLEDRLCTFVHVLALKLRGELLAHTESEQLLKPRLLLTGGGAENSFLVDVLRAKTSDLCHLVVPSIEVIRYKEALIFGFLGLRRLMGATNALSSVTGALHESVGGALYGALKV